MWRNFVPVSFDFFQKVLDLETDALDHRCSYGMMPWLQRTTNSMRPLQRIGRPCTEKIGSFGDRVIQFPIFLPLCLIVLVAHLACTLCKTDLGINNYFGLACEITCLPDFGVSTLLNSVVVSNSPQTHLFHWKECCIQEIASLMKASVKIMEIWRVCRYFLFVDWLLRGLQVPMCCPWWQCKIHCFDMFVRFVSTVRLIPNIPSNVCLFLFVSCFFFLLGSILDFQEPLVFGFRLGVSLCCFLFCVLLRCVFVCVCVHACVRVRVGVCSSLCVGSAHRGRRSQVYMYLPAKVTWSYCCRLFSDGKSPSMHALGLSQSFIFHFQVFHRPAAPTWN